MVADLSMVHSLNFIAGWWLILSAFLTGAAIGLGFHREQFLGGYGAFRRRLVRLGHIALAALGGLNVLYGISPLPAASSHCGTLPGPLLLASGFGGAIVLTAADIAVRLIPVHPELKLGVVTALIGAPFLFGLIDRLRREA